MKYKKGDKVKVRSDLEVDKVYGESRYSSPMGQHKGEIVTISEVQPAINTYHIEDQHDYWTDEMFEGLANSENEVDFVEAIKQMESGKKAMNIVLKTLYRIKDAFLQYKEKYDGGRWFNSCYPHYIIKSKWKIIEEEKKSTFESELREAYDNKCFGDILDVIKRYLAKLENRTVGKNKSVNEIVKEIFGIEVEK
ncbi:hypothetical protein LCGC14_2625480 [marine sediment metagenome]|uniref:Uncharacterized protein n=1 Tax=marine sediment metagenome TaxID=412755 RepID=A0A0F9A1S4_9ZZZZ